MSRRSIVKRAKVVSGRKAFTRKLYEEFKSKYYPDRSPALITLHQTRCRTVMLHYRRFTWVNKGTVINMLSGMDRRQLDSTYDRAFTREIRRARKYVRSLYEHLDL